MYGTNGTNDVTILIIKTKAGAKNWFQIRLVPNSSPINVLFCNVDITI